MNLKINEHGDWSLLNASNLFKAISVPSMFKYSETAPYPEKFERVRNAFLLDTEHNPQRLDVVRRHRVRPRPSVNRLAFPVSNKYTTYKQLKTAYFFIELYKVCKSNGFFEPKLLLNHAVFTPWWPSIYYNKSYKFKANVDKSYAQLFHSFIRSLVSRSSLDNIKLYAHKTTTPGPPFKFANGRFYEKEDFVFGYESDIKNNVANAMRKDYTKIKQSYFEYFSDIHHKQKELSVKGIENLSISEILSAYHDSSLPTGVKGYRGNSMDTPVNIDVNTPVNIYTRVYTKDRFFTLFTKDGVMSGLVDNKSVCDFFYSYFGYFFAATRNREIFNQNYASQFSASVEARMILSGIEDTVNGFASNSDVMLLGYSKFLNECFSRGSGKFLFLNGDRTNAETTITTNYDEFKELIPPEVRDLYSFQNLAIMLDDIPYVFEGLPSGMARTTLLNWMVGTYEAIYSLAQILNIKIVELAKAYFESILSDQPFFVIQDFVIKIFMCTDDIPIIIFTKEDLDDRLQRFVKNSESRMMSWQYSYEKMSTFGMTFTPQELKPNEVSIISKLFYSEHPGFFVKDCFSIYCKLQLIPATLRRDILRLLEKMYATDQSFYDHAARAFLGWLKEFNIPISEAVDVYSPAGKLIYGKFTSKDDILESSRVPFQYIESIFDDYKKIYRR